MRVLHITIMLILAPALLFPSGFSVEICLCDAICAETRACCERDGETRGGPRCCEESPAPGLRGCSGCFQVSQPAAPAYAPVDGVPAAAPPIHAAPAPVVAVPAIPVLVGEARPVHRRPPRSGLSLRSAVLLI